MPLEESLQQFELGAMPSESNSEKNKLRRKYAASISAVLG